MMPKGVEHVSSPSLPTWDVWIRVQSAVMPKGVEHYVQHADGSSEVGVQSAVMPKGVEHVPVIRAVHRTLTPGAVSRDAERR